MDVKIAQVQAMADAQFAQNMKRAQSKSDRVEKAKQEVYAHEDAVFEEMSELNKELEEGTSTPKKILNVATSIFGFGSGMRGPEKRAHVLGAKQKKLQSELSTLKAEQGRAMELAHRSVSDHQRAGSATAQSLEGQKAVQSSKHAKGGQVKGGVVPMGQVARVEAQVVESAQAVATSAGQRMERALGEEAELLQGAADQEMASLEAAAGRKFGAQLGRLAFTVISVGQAAATALPKSPIGVLTPMHATRLAAEVLGSAASGAVPAAFNNAGAYGIAEPVINAQRDGGLNKAAKTRVLAERQARAASGAEGLKKEGWSQYASAQDTVSELRGSQMKA